MSDPGAVLHSVLTTVFETTVRLPLEVATAGPSTRPGERTSAAKVWAVVGIEGAKRYGVVLETSEQLARRVAGSMLDETFPEWSHEVEDAFAELANIVAGNVKAVLPEHLRLTLSLPSVIHGRENFWSVPKMRLVAERFFVCEEESLRIWIGDGDGGGAPSAAGAG